MDIAWRKQGQELVAKMDCRTGRRRLQSGRQGWYQVAELQWLYNWKVRVQVSVTEYGVAEPLPREGQTRDRQELMSPWGPGNVRFLVEDDVLEIIFPADCIYPFKSKKAWGWSEGCPIPLSTGKHHCQALLIAKPPRQLNCYLRINGDFLEFVESRRGVTHILT